MLARWRRRFRQARTERIDHDLLRHFTAGIESELDLHEAGGVGDVADGVDGRGIAVTIRAKLAEISRRDTIEENWSRAYHAEKLLIALLSDARVRVELSRRLDRLAGMEVPFASFYQGMLSQIDDPARASDTEPATARRNLLVAMVDDVQAYRGKRFIKMRYARTAIYRIGSAFAIAFAIFLIVLARGHWVPDAASARLHDTRLVGVPGAPS